MTTFRKTYRRMITRICSFCGEEFKASRVDAKFCSSKCKTANWRTWNAS